MEHRRRFHDLAHTAVWGYRFRRGRFLGLGSVGSWGDHGTDVTTAGFLWAYRCPVTCANDTIVTYNWNYTWSSKTTGGGGHWTDILTLLGLVLSATGKVLGHTTHTSASTTNGTRNTTGGASGVVGVAVHLAAALVPRTTYTLETYLSPYVQALGVSSSQDTTDGTHLSVVIS